MQQEHTFKSCIQIENESACVARCSTRAPMEGEAVLRETEFELGEKIR
jgi:hypothetical protein